MLRTSLASRAKEEKEWKFAVCCKRRVKLGQGSKDWREKGRGGEEEEHIF